MRKWISGIFYVALLSALLVLTSCGRQEKHGDDDGHNHGAEAKVEKDKKGDHEHEGEEHEEGEGITYQEGKGIELPDETQKAMGLEIAKVSEEVVSPTINVTAQIYRAASEASRVYGKERQGYAYATALVPPDVAIKTQTHQKVTFAQKGASSTSYQGIVWKTLSTQNSVLGKVEVIMELPDKENRFPVGEFVDVKIAMEGAAQKKTTIPQSAVLETSSGSFAFVKKDHFLLRIPIKLGAQSGDIVEVVDGLQVGDEIVTKSVESLYLIELRSTKGGGHAH